MTENERTALEAAKAWHAHPSESRAAALHKAMAALEADTCPKRAIGGDLAWPVRYTCILPSGHNGDHEDASRGKWTMR